MSEPLVSVGMPAHNGELYLEETLSCVLEQTFSNLEIVISDNASDDRTGEICRDFASSDPRIRYHRNEINLGAATNYNKVFSMSSGKYFKWAAVDDLFSPDLIARCVDALEIREEVVLCYPKTSIINTQGDVVGDYEDGLDLRFEDPSQRFIQLLELVGECNAVFGLIRSNILRRTGLIGNYVASDIVLLAELCLYGPFFEIPERLFLRRDHPSASSNSRSVRDQQEFFDPKTVGRISMRAWRHHTQHLRSVLKSPIGTKEKLLTASYLGRHAIWARKALARELMILIKSKLRA